MTDFESLLRALHEAGIDFIVERAAGRPRDLEVLAELEAIQEETSEC